jgi:formamidopyrimidine-DNA glycosylase
MPELPDVVGFQRYLEATSLHQRVAKTRVNDGRLLEDVTAGRLARCLKGRRLEGTTRHGKYLFARAGEGWLLLHFGMTGDLHYWKGPGTDPDYAQVIFDFENDAHLAYINKRILGKVGFIHDMDGYIDRQGLGLDVLAGDLTGGRFAKLLAGRSGPIKARLMDQSLIAGVGNIYSDEILFQARLHPQTDASDLSADDIQKLYRVMRRVLRVAAGKGGDLGKFPRGYFLPSREKGAPCPRCGGEVTKIVVVGRSGYFCPQCQKPTY